MTTSVILFPKYAKFGTKTYLKLRRGSRGGYSTNYGTLWHANFGIDPKLAEAAPLFYRATDVPFLPKWNIDPKLAEIAPLLY